MRALVLVPILFALPCCKADSAGSPSAPEPRASVVPAAPVASAASAPSRGVAGQVVHLQADAEVATEPMPASPHGHGEALRAIWTADDGTTFAVGYMYVGVAGHDTGAVYRRAPGGAWELAYSKKGCELGRVWGRSASDVYAGGLQTLAHFDGKAWTEIAIPQIEGSISGIWGNATDLWVSAGHQYTARVYRRDKAGAWTVDLRAEVMLFNLGGAGSSVWAVGSSGAIFHRDKDGGWKREAEDRTKQYTSVWASADDDVYVAGAELMHSRGDGAWTAVDLPVSGPLRYVWGRGKDDVLVGAPGGLVHLAGGRWTITGFTLDSAGVGGVGADLFVAHNDLR